MRWVLRAHPHYANSVTVVYGKFAKPDMDKNDEHDKYDKLNSTKERWSKAYRDARKGRQAHARAMMQNKIVDQTLIIKKLRESLDAWKTWYNSGQWYSYIADAHLYSYAADDHK